MGYFKGNTRARRERIKKIHAKFVKHQNRWMARRLASNFGKR